MYVLPFTEAWYLMPWVEPAELGDYPFPAANARILAALQKHLAAGTTLA